MSDAVAVLLYLFAGNAAPPCLKSADADDSGEINVTDPVRMLQYLFQGGALAAPAAPDCGLDAMEGGLSCEAFAACGG